MLETKRSFIDDVNAGDHEDKKPHTKPGRKPIEAEPKSKRTAQNRAAQRAYRERKERKMKDLEERVAHLEDDKIKASTEKDLLQAQVELLKRELSRFQGPTDISSILVDAKKAKLAHPPTKSEFSIKTESPNSQLPDLVSGSSSSTSPLDDTLQVSPESDTSVSVYQSLSPQNQFSLVSGFEEQVDPFCVNLNEACGTKEKPQPKYYRLSEPVPALLEEESKPLGEVWNSNDSPFQTLFTPSETNASDPFFMGTGSNIHLPTTDANDDPLSFLNDKNFDVSLALGPGNDVFPREKAEADPLADLITEESVYDPFNSVNTNFTFNEFVKSSLPSDVSSSRADSVLDAGTSESSYTSLNAHTSPAMVKEPQEVVPAGDDQVRCSEIWDRITTHPRYTDIDIDGLCSELKTKARCSELGVVLNNKDVDSLIERSVLKD